MTDYSPQHIASLLSGQVVVGVDPGDTTGVAVLYDNRHNFESIPREQWFEYSIDACGLDQPEVVWVVEQFVTRPAQFAKLQYAPRVIGAIEYHAALYGQQVVFQQPSVIKTMIDPKDLKTAGWKWNTDHEKDALRHALYYILTRK